MSEKIKRIGCFTDEQQSFYEKLSPRQRAYVEFRGRGYSKGESYKMAGFGGNNPAQAGGVIERRSKGIQELISALASVNKAKEITNPDSPLNKQINALALQKTAENMLSVVEKADGETAQRIQFYRDIINGKIKTVKKITRRGPNGELIETRIEELSDVATKIRAREYLDRILGLNNILPDIDKIQAGEITINIVDASKKEEKAEGKAEEIELSPNKVENIDGEQCLVVEDK